MTKEEKSVLRAALRWAKKWDREEYTPLEDTYDEAMALLRACRKIHAEVHAVPLEWRTFAALLAAARERLRKEVDALLPHEGVAPEWLDRCGKDHIDQFAANPARWPICLGCVFSALKAALAGKEGGNG